MQVDTRIVEETVRSILEKNGAQVATGKEETAHQTLDISLDFAEKLMKHVEEEAKRMGMRVVTAVSDSHANPVAVRCMDEAYVGSFDVALNKTYTAVAFKMSTEELGTLSQPGGPLYGIQHTNQGRIVIFGGHPAKNRQSSDRRFRRQRWQRTAGYLSGSLCCGCLP